MMECVKHLVKTTALVKDNVSLCVTTMDASLGNCAIVDFMHVISEKHDVALTI